jgi:hypothetical protein
VTAPELAFHASEIADAVVPVTRKFPGAPGAPGPGPPPPLQEVPLTVQFVGSPLPAPM